MRLIMIRHGYTKLNRENRYCGSTDEPLDHSGAATAAEIGGDTTKKLVFVSPQKRAVQTAALLFPAAKLLPVAGLREMDFGVFEGHTGDELMQDPRYVIWLNGNCEGPCPDGESQSAFFQRVRASFSRILFGQFKLGAAETVLVAHGGTIMAVMTAFSEEKRTHNYNWHVKNLGGYEAQVSIAHEDDIIISNVRDWRQN